MWLDQSAGCDRCRNDILGTTDSTPTDGGKQMNFRLGWDGGVQTCGVRAVDRDHQPRPQPLSLAQPLARAGELLVKRVEHFAQRSPRDEQGGRRHSQPAEFGIRMDPRHDSDRKAAPGGSVNLAAPVPDH